MKKNIFLRFKDDERGLATIESLLWMPVFFYLFILITDVSFIFFGKSQALRIIQDGNRAYSTGAYGSAAEAEAQIQTRLREFSPSAIAQTGLNSADSIIETTGTLSINELMAIGSIPVFVGGTITVTHQHYKEF